MSLGKVESVLKGCPVIQDICIYGDSTKSYVVSLVVPARPALSDIAQKFGKSKLTFQQLCEDKDITGAVLREIINQVTMINLMHNQIMIAHNHNSTPRVNRANWRSLRSPGL